jgi:hypothetical protein
MTRTYVLKDSKGYIGKYRDHTTLSCFALKFTEAEALAAERDNADISAVNLLTLSKDVL